MMVSILDSFHGFYDKDLVVRTWEVILSWSVVINTTILNDKLNHPFGHLGSRNDRIGDTTYNGVWLEAILDDVQLSFH